MSTQINNNYQLVWGIRMIFILSILVIVFKYLPFWEYTILADNGEHMFWLWVRILFYSLIIYNVFRIYDFTKSTAQSQRDDFRAVFMRSIMLITLLFFPVIVSYIVSILVKAWIEGNHSLDSPGAVLYAILEFIWGEIQKFVWWLYQLFLDFSKKALEKVSGDGLVYGIPIKDSIIIQHIIVITVLTTLIRIRKAVVFIANSSYNVANYLKVIFLGRKRMSDKGILRIIYSKMSWFKRLIYFLLGIDLLKADNSRGSATWATKAQEGDIVQTKLKGLLIDGNRRLSWKDSMSHIAILAPSGKGKTASYVIPNVLGVTEFINPVSGTSASLVITDPKGEIFETTSKYLEEQGYTIKVINVEEPLRSEHFNPVKRATTDREIAKLAQILVGSGISDTKNNNKDFWGQAAEMLLTLVIKIIKRSNVPNEHQNLHNIRHFVDLMGGDGKPIAPFVQKHCSDTQVITEYASFIQQDPETLSNIIITVKTILKDLSIKEIAQLTGDDTIDFELLRRDKTAVFIITPFSDIEYYRFFLTILYSQLFSYCDKNSKGNDIVFMLDEFGNLGRIPSFDKLITTLRSKRCSISIILQDIEQLRKTYGNSDAKTILNGGCSSKIFFGGIQNLDTLKEVSQMLGNQTISQKSKEGRDMGTIARPLMMPDEISRMEIGTAILLSSGRLPVKLKLQKFDDTKLHERLYRDEYGDLLAVDLPTYSNTTVNYFPFDNYIDDVVED